MKFNKSHFWYTKSQRNGILFLALIILISQGVIIWFKFRPSKVLDTNSKIAQAIQVKIDSLKSQKSKRETTLKIYPFNPSFLTDEKGYKLGMTPDEIDRILAHRAQGKFINSAKEFQKISQISDSLLTAIQPYFKFPTWLTNQREHTTIKPQPKTAPRIAESKVEKHVIADLNTASVDALISVRGIGKKLADRIVKYRKKLGGFSVNDQLYEVYYLDREVADKVLTKFSVLSKPNIVKLNINTASFKEVLNIPYIDYALTKKIFAYRDEIAEYQSLVELKNIEGFPLDNFERIALYLSVK
ncbi:helix-hairpin-helix domain-containing protein [Flavobacteriaceae bacterium F08102]|nr:helix-hairpin-helix domain-containing protein [Flavobacteriaceae bacterium F08102]